MRGKSKLTLEQKNQRLKALLGDENVPNLENLTKDQFSKLVIEHREVIERNLYRINVLNEVEEVFHTKDPLLLPTCNKSIEHSIIVRIFASEKKPSRLKGSRHH